MLNICCSGICNNPEFFICEISLHFRLQVRLQMSGQGIQLNRLDDPADQKRMWGIEIVGIDEKTDDVNHNDAYEPDRDIIVSE